VVKKPLTQGQFDALVSLSYNIGIGALSKSTLLHELNAGNYAGAASHFADWKKARVHGDTAKLYGVADGTLMTLPGLVSRRAAETALFLEAAHVETMPQEIAAPDRKYKIKEAALKIGGGALAAGEIVRQGVPSVPTELTESIGNVKAWKDTTTTVYGAGKEAWGAAAAYPILAAVIVLAGAGLIVSRMWKR
jgi:hypothetical protein